MARFRRMVVGMLGLDVLQKGMQTVTETVLPEMVHIAHRVEPAADRIDIPTITSFRTTWFIHSKMRSAEQSFTRTIRIADQVISSASKRV